MPTTTAIVREHRDAAKRLRKKLRDARAARKFLVRAGILSKGGRKLAASYR